MNGEEKIAVEFVKERTKELKKYAKRENELIYDDIVLNLIDKLLKENEYMKSLFEVQASIAQELDFGTPDKMIKFKDTYYVPDTMSIINNIGEPKRLDLSYVDVSKFLVKE